MGLHIADLGQIGGAVLAVLTALPSADRRTIAASTGLKPQQISRSLMRLEAMGLVSHPEQYGSDWVATKSGHSLLNPQISTISMPSSPELPVVPEIPTDAETNADAIVEAEYEMKSQADDDDFDPTAWTPEPPAVNHDTNSDAIAADLLAAMEIEVALDQVRTKLRSAAIPSRAQRVYHEVLSALPPVLIEALAPVTALVDAHNL